MSLSSQARLAKSNANIARTTAEGRPVKSSNDLSRNPALLFDQKSTGPAPNQNYYQLSIDADKRSVILREWPKQRFSQKYTPALNPAQVTVPWGMQNMGFAIINGIILVF
jgi:hypothetical protein